MAQAAYDHFNSVLGEAFARTRRLNLEAFGLPSLGINVLENVFTEDEIKGVIMSMPNDRAPGLDGFTGIFYKKTWEIIKHDVMMAFHAFWACDMRSLHHLNDALMVLLKKKEVPAGLKTTGL